MKYNVEDAEYIIAPNGKKYRMGVMPIGDNFGQVGVLVAKNGRVVAVTDDVYPMGNFKPSMEEYQKLAESI
jgi:hypothetical protein